MLEYANGIRTPFSRENSGITPSTISASTMSRRSLLRLGILGVGGSSLALLPGNSGIAEFADPSPDDRAMIVRSQRPLNLESPIGALDHRLTPNDLFFVRSHFGAPAVDLHPWQVEVVGLVDHPLHLSLADLAGLPGASRTAVLQCAGNGRGLYRPRVPGATMGARRGRAGGMVGGSLGRSAGARRVSRPGRFTCTSSAAMRLRRPRLRPSSGASRLRERWTRARFSPPG